MVNFITFQFIEQLQFNLPIKISLLTSIVKKRADKMIDKETRKKLKKIQKETDKLNKELKKLEFRPCQNDADLKKKDEDLKSLREKILSLEKEQDRYMLHAGGIEHGGV